MKIILSRKGFDSANGGIVSPIFEDGTMVSFPFPVMMRIHMILFTTMEFSILKYCEICDIRAETTVIWTLI